MKATRKIALQPGTKLLQLGYEPEDDAYILWLHHDLQMRHGTFLRLNRGGKIERVTVGLDGTETIVDIT